MIDSLRLAASIVLAVASTTICAAMCGGCASAPEPHAQASLTSFALVSNGSAVEVARRTGEVTTTSRSSSRKVERKNDGHKRESLVGFDAVP